MASCSALRLNKRFAAGFSDDDIHGDRVSPNQEKNLVKQYTNPKKMYNLAQASSKAKWVELPDCSTGTLDAEEVPLKTDLSNAIIATCKAYNPSATSTSSSSSEPEPTPL